ncbi:hypothetical protein INT45_008226 [Circinella minor]|uniref:Uncharacterized protein n=1 Tax=Circinella minor TaxID=1195481 RepID=A0A8H7S1Y4_9FUNG|nr:hypothetical protein INT45_008226 [Circinella minor]
MKWSIQQCVQFLPIFGKIHGQPTISFGYVIDLLCQHFKNLTVTNCDANNHMRKKCHYKLTVRYVVAYDDDTALLQWYESVPSWMVLEINFFSEYILIDEPGFVINTLSIAQITGPTLKNYEKYPFLKLKYVA